MSKRANRIGCLLVAVFLLGMVGITAAEPLLPLFEGQVCTYHKRKANGVEWTALAEVMGERVTLGGQDYFLVETWNWENESEWRDLGYLRSTEDAVYIYNPYGPEYVMFQKAPVGTQWGFPDDYEGYPYHVVEVAAIEPVAVPYGTFALAYKYRQYVCEDPADLSLGKSPDWYNWIVPGVGMVKEQDYWSDVPPAIQELTSMSVAPVYRFWSPVNSRHFYTVSESEKQNVISTYPHIWTYEGTAYYTFGAAGESGTQPVHRFWSNALSAHFYTISEAERDKLINTYGQIWAYEGPAFYAFPEGSQPAGASPTYRFWSNTLGYHFYTMSAAERDKVISLYPDVWTYEGIAWYAYE